MMLPMNERVFMAAKRVFNLPQREQWQLQVDILNFFSGEEKRMADIWAAMPQYDQTDLQKEVLAHVSTGNIYKRGRTRGSFFITTKVGQAAKSALEKQIAQWDAGGK